MFNRKSTEVVRRGDWFDPFATLARMTSDVDRLFEEAGWPAFRTSGVTRSAAWSPNLDVFEKNGYLMARADLPGLEKEDVKVEVIDGYLTIAGERKLEAEEKRETFYRREREYCSFYRAVPLPDGVDAGKVKATFDNGVLEITVSLPARAETKPHAVTIEEAHGNKAAQAA